jgi:predicted phage-related endonuclease
MSDISNAGSYCPTTPEQVTAAEDALAAHVATFPSLLEPRQSPTLAELVDAYAAADEAVKASEDHRKDLRDQLLQAMQETGQRGADLIGTRAVVKIGTTSAWRVDTKRLKSEQPALYAAYARESTSTRLTVTPR